MEAERVYSQYGHHVATPKFRSLKHFLKKSPFKETVGLKIGSITHKSIMTSSLLDAGGGVFSLADRNRPTIHSFSER
jgi:hypothetical protein